jgi:hypothetical protein
METMQIIKNGIIGGIIIIVIELLVGIAAPTIAFGFSIIALLVGGAISGWMVHGKLEDGAFAGAASGLFYGIFGLLILYPLLSSRFRHTPATYVVEIVGSIIIAAIGGFAGKYLATHQGSTKSQPKKGKRNK